MCAYNSITPFLVNVDSVFASLLPSQTVLQKIHKMRNVFCTVHKMISDNNNDDDDQFFFCFSSTSLLASIVENGRANHLLV